jgi:hypothetical protein
MVTWVFISPPSAGYKLMATNTGALASKRHSYGERVVSMAIKEQQDVNF